MTTAEPRAGRRIAIEGMLFELDNSDLIVDERGGMMQYVSAAPTDNPEVFGVAFLFVSEDQSAQVELQQRLSRYIAAGLPDFES